MEKLVSILMPAYNCERFIHQAIDSVLNQTYTNFELLIADDCSTDNTKKIIDSYTDERIKRFHNLKNQGYLKASNLLFKQCKGDYITFQDADDYSDIKRLEKLVDFLEKNTDMSIVGSNNRKVDENGVEGVQSNFPENHQNIIVNFENYKTVFTGSSLMLKRKVIEDIGIYNEYFDRIGSEDIYWYSQIIIKYKTANLPEALYIYRANSNSVSRTHKNPKAFVCHDLIMKMHFRRKKGKKDFIARQATWKHADIYAQFLIEIRNLKLTSKKMSMVLLKLMIIHPITTLQFLSEIKKAIK